MCGPESNEIRCVSKIQCSYPPPRPATTTTTTTPGLRKHLYLCPGVGVVSKVLRDVVQHINELPVELSVVQALLRKTGGVRYRLPGAAVRAKVAGPTL